MGLVLLCVAVFGQSVRFDFVGYDDILYVTENPMVLKGISWASVAESWHYVAIAEWQPLTFISHMLDVELFGLNASGHHGVNVFWHSVNVVLLYTLLLRMTGNPLGSLAVALIFAIHPYQSEPVAWVSSRKDLLYTACTLIAFLLYVEHVLRKSRLAYVGAFAFACVALTAKPSAILIPFFLVFLDYWPLERAGRGPAWGRFLRVAALDKIPFAIMTCAGLIHTLHVGEELDVTSASDAWPLHLRLANAATCYLLYLRKVFWPSGFSAFYPHPGVDTSVAVGICAFVVLVITTFLIYRMRQSRPYVAVGWCWFIVALAPVIGLIPIGTHRMADRYMYLAILGPAIAIVWSITDIERRRTRQIVSVVLAGWIGLLSLVAFQQTRVWQSAETLWTHAVRLDASNALAWNNLGSYYVDRGDFETGLPYLQSAVEHAPHWGTAQGNLGDAYLALSRPADAAPRYEAALAINANEARSLNGLGVCYLLLGRPIDALNVLQTLVAAAPESAEYRYHLGLAHLANGDTERAANEFEAALRIESDFQLARDRLRGIRSGAGDL